MLDMEAEEQTYRQDSPIENHRGPLNLLLCRAVRGEELKNLFIYF